jgi:hypothetical protein
MHWHIKLKINHQLTPLIAHGHAGRRLASETLRLPPTKNVNVVMLTAQAPKEKKKSACLMI